MIQLTNQRQDDLNFGLHQKDYISLGIPCGPMHSLLDVHENSNHLKSLLTFV